MPFGDEIGKRSISGEQGREKPCPSPAPLFFMSLFSCTRPSLIMELIDRTLSSPFFYSFRQLLKLIGVNGTADGAFASAARSTAFLANPKSSKGTLVVKVRFGLRPRVSSSTEPHSAMCVRIEKNPTLISTNQIFRKFLSVSNK